MLSENLIKNLFFSVFSFFLHCSGMFFYDQENSFKGLNICLVCFHVEVISSWPFVSPVKASDPSATMNIMYQVPLPY